MGFFRSLKHSYRAKPKWRPHTHETESGEVHDMQLVKIIETSPGNGTRKWRCLICKPLTDEDRADGYSDNLPQPGGSQ